MLVSIRSCKLTMIKHRTLIHILDIIMFHLEQLLLLRNQLSQIKIYDILVGKIKKQLQNNQPLIGNLWLVVKKNYKNFINITKFFLHAYSYKYLLRIARVFACEVAILKIHKDTFFQVKQSLILKIRVCSVLCVIIAML